MEEDILFSIRQINCNHRNQELYTQRQFDILNGFEFNLTRCLKCYKIVDLQSKSFSKC